MPDNTNISEEVQNIKDRFESIERDEQKAKKDNQQQQQEQGEKQGNNSNRVARDSVEEILKSNYEAYEEKRKEAYLKSINATDVDFEKLDTKQKLEYNKFDLSDEEKKELFKNTIEGVYDKDGTLIQEGVKQKIGERNDRLNGSRIPEVDADGNKLKGEDGKVIYKKNEKGDDYLRDGNGIITAYDNLVKEIDKLLEETKEKLESRDFEKEIAEKDARINEIDQKLASPDLDKAERESLTKEKEDLTKEKSDIDNEHKKLENDITELNSTREKINGKDGRVTKLIADQEHAKSNAIEAMSLMYGPELVYNSEEIKDIEPKKGKFKDQYEKTKEEALAKARNSKEGQQQAQNVQDTPNQAGAYYYVAPGMANNGQRVVVPQQQGANVVGGNPQQVATFVDQNGNTVDQNGNIIDQDGNVIDQNGNEVEQPKNISLEQAKAQEALEWIGYDASRPMKVSTAKALLKNFTKEQSRQLDILKDPESAKVIFSAMEKVGNANFFRRIGYGSIRKDLLVAAKRYLPRAAVEEYKKLNPDYKGMEEGHELDEFDELKNKYNDELQVLNKKYENQEITPEIQKEYDELRNKYDPISGTAEFQFNSEMYVEKKGKYGKLFDNAYVEAIDGKREDNKDNSQPSTNEKDEESLRGELGSLKQTVEYIDVNKLSIEDYEKMTTEWKAKVKEQIGLMTMDGELKGNVKNLSEYIAEKNAQEIVNSQKDRKAKEIE